MAGDIIDLGMRVDTRDMDRGKKKVDEFGGAVKKADKDTAVAAASMRKKFLMIGAAVTAAVGALRSLGATINVIANFENSMSAVAAITRSTASELEAMRKVAKDLGSTTEFTASQAADGLKFLGMAGFQASESIAAIPDVLNLATAAQMDLARAADISSNVMSAFRIPATQAGKAADALAAIASRANTNVEQLGDAMKFVGPIASSIGVDVNKAAAAIGVLSDNGLQGSMAGTGLRRVMSSLLNPTKEAVGILQAYGLTLDELNPATNELTDIVARLADAGLDAGDALTIFGDRGAPAILALTANVPRLRELTAEMANVEGEAERMATTMRDNLQGDIQSLRSAIEGLMLAVGDAGLTSALRAVTQAVTGFVRAVSQAIDGASRLTQIVAEDINRWTKLGTAISFVTGIFDYYVRSVVVGLEAVASATVWTADKFVSIWVGTVDAVITAFKTIPEALEAVFVGALNGILALFTNFVNGIIEDINRLLEFAGRETIKTIDGFQIQSDASIANVGTKIMESFKSGMGRVDLKGYLSGVMNEAFGAPDTSNQRAADSYLSFLNGRVDGNSSEETVPGGRGPAGDAGGGGAEKPKIDERLEDAKRLFQETRTEAELYAMELSDINELLQLGYIDQDTYNRALEQLREDYLGAGDAAKFFEEQMNAVKSGIVDAIVEGKSLQDTLAGVAKAIAKAALEAALFGSGPMSGLFGGGAGILSFIPGFASGTNNAPGGLSLVGERGPELVNLPKGSQVVPSDKTMQMLQGGGISPEGSKPSVNVKNINVLDPSLVGDYLATPQGEEMIMNVVSRNQGTI